MDSVTNKKLVGIAVLHFITACLALTSFVFIFFAIFYGDLLLVDGLDGEFGGYVAGFGLMAFLSSGVVVLLTVPSFVINGYKLVAQARGKSPARKSYTITLVLKIIAVFIMFYGLLYMVGLIYMGEGSASSIITVVLHSVTILLGLISSLFEAYVRRKP